MSQNPRASAMLQNPITPRGGMAMFNPMASILYIVLSIDLTVEIYCKSSVRSQIEEG
jgi:hypothetical protein